MMICVCLEALDFSGLSLLSVIEASSRAYEAQQGSASERWEGTAEINLRGDMGALMIRIGFCGTLYYN